MLSNYLELINEIITAKEYKAYKKSLKGLDVKEYKKILPQLKKIFTALNNGKFARNAIFDYNSIILDNVKLNDNDIELIKILNKAGYETTETSYLVGVCAKDGKMYSPYEVLKPLQEKIDKIESMEKAYEKSKNENIKKQIDVLKELKELELDSIYLEKTKAYKIFNDKKYKIVFSMESRKIASQSTKVGWESCMNLNDGVNKRYVMSGIEQGVIVVYLVKTGDEKTIDNPIGRVLIKPFKLKDNENEILWKVDAIYGTTPVDFKNKVEKIFEKFSSKVQDLFFLSSKIYPDTLGKIKANISASEEEWVKDEFNKIKSGERTRTETIDYFKKVIDNMAYLHTIVNHDTDFERLAIKFLMPAKEYAVLEKTLTYQLKHDLLEFKVITADLINNFSNNFLDAILELPNGYVSYDLLVNNADKINSTKALYIIKNLKKDHAYYQQIFSAFRNKVPRVYLKKEKMFMADMPEKEAIEYFVNTKLSREELYENFGNYIKNKSKKQTREFVDSIVEKLQNKDDKILSADTIIKLNVFIEKAPPSKKLLIAYLSNERTNIQLTTEQLYALGATNIVKFINLGRIRASGTLRTLLLTEQILVNKFIAELPEDKLNDAQYSSILSILSDYNYSSSKVTLNYEQAEKIFSYSRYEELLTYVTYLIRTNKEAPTFADKKKLLKIPAIKRVLAKSVYDDLLKYIRDYNKPAKEKRRRMLSEHLSLYLHNR